MSTLLPRNEHNIERVLRVILGLAMLGGGAAALSSSWLGLLGLIGLVPLFTGAVGSCPLYTLFGISTCSIKAAG